jgi:hypothetical protein
VLVFSLGLRLMRERLIPVTPFLCRQLSVWSLGSALGFDWIGSSLALSGSPASNRGLRRERALGTVVPFLRHGLVVDDVLAELRQGKS